ncbi:MAG: AarF/ABC1/UbiB kinase family protein [Cyanobacteriota bacterium]|nr:AarF/ABC1/UbiB kinase family protein [Cyanobacteriota bacterium]
MFLRFAQTSGRQAEILEVVFRNGWDYMRRLLAGSKPDTPQLPPPAVFRNILVELGPVYVKLGQLLSTRPDLLPPSYIQALTDLQANVPAVDWRDIEIVIRQQLRDPLEETFQTIQTIPVAAGSIAQTHRATLKDGREVALKVQRPAIEKIVEQDMSLIRGLAELVAQTEFGRVSDVVGLADEFAAALRAELSFTQEATYTDQLRQNMSNSRWFQPNRLVIPEIFWSLTTDRLLVMEWLEGEPLLKGAFGSTSSDSQTERAGIASLLTRAFFQQICIDGFFHADPHPGNLFYLQDGRVALLDCGMMGRLDPRTQQILLELILSIVSLDAQRCSELTLQLAPPTQPINLARLEADYERLLRQYYSLSVSQLNFSLLFYEVLEAARRNQIRIPGNLGLCAKSLANLEGVARQLDPEFNLPDQIRPLMTDLFRKQLIGEAPVPAILRAALDLKTLSLQSPRQLEVLLNRVTSETLRWNLQIQELDAVRQSVDNSANRLSFSIVVGSLIMGAAMISSQAQRLQVYWVSEVLFAAASLLGLWLIISILRSGRLRE